MKKLLSLLFILLISSSCVDPFGLFIPYVDINDRFQDSMKETVPAFSLATNTNYTFLVISDIHNYDSVNSNFAKLDSKVIATDQFIAATGDLAQSGSSKEFSTYMSSTSSLSRPDLSTIPVYNTIGNHDLYWGNWNNALNAIGPSTYTLTNKPGLETETTRLIFLDSASGSLGSAQYNWLKNVLKNKTEDFCFVFTHYNFFCYYFFELQHYTDTEEIAALMYLFEKYNVTAVFNGHSHIYESRSINGVQYINASAFNDNGESKKVIRASVNFSPNSFSFTQINLD